MKRIGIAWILPLLVLSAACDTDKSEAQRLMENYAEVTLPAPDLTGISDNGKEVLNLYRFIANEADAIFWQQNGSDRESMEALADPDEKAYAMINYGPWDRLDGKPFVEGYGPKPAGSGFYPEDMTQEEFDALQNPDKNSPYTLITRGEDNALKVVWYHEAYAAQVRKMEEMLKAAADITIKESVRDYLLTLADAVATDNYYESARAWLAMNDSRMDLVLGPNETLDDHLYGKKASYGAYVLLKNEARTAQLNRLSARLPEFQQMLPGDPLYHQFEPQPASDVFSCDVLYYGGYPNAGFKNIAVNFPYDTKAQEELGTRTILFDNIIREKFNRTVFPVGIALFDGDDRAHLDANAFYWMIVFREVAKGLGVKETVNGKGTVADALGAQALTFEKAKSNVLGTWLCVKEVSAHRIDALVQKQDVLATFVANVIRSCRFGTDNPTGKANLMTYNYLLEQGAFTLKESGRYDIDFVRTEHALEDLGATILHTQATGDEVFARDFIARYAVLSPSLTASIVSLRLEKIPVDIRLTYEK